MKEAYKEVREEEQSRYTIGFVLFVLILLASVGAVFAKAILVLMGD